jgi:hypothetical protein
MTKSKQKTTPKKGTRRPAAVPSDRDPWEDDKALYEEKKGGVFSPGEMGQTGKRDQDGEGNRQNDELAELAEVEPDEETKGE